MYVSPASPIISTSLACSGNRQNVPFQSLRYLELSQSEFPLSVFPDEIEPLLTKLFPLVFYRQNYKYLLISRQCCYLMHTRFMEALLSPRNRLAGWDCSVSALLVWTLKPFTAGTLLGTDPGATFLVYLWSIKMRCGFLQTILSVSTKLFYCYPWMNNNLLPRLE
jgi:hypothetical protein